MAVNQKTLVFVYGTLRKGSSNHFRLGKAPLRGRAWILGRLYRIDWYPGLRLDGEGVPVRGELYEIERELLRELDAFEGSEYERLKATVHAEDGETLYAWLYEYRGEVDPRTELLPADWQRFEMDGQRGSSFPWFSLATFSLLPATLVLSVFMILSGGASLNSSGWIGRLLSVALLLLPFLTGTKAQKYEERWAEGAGACAAFAFISFWLLLLVWFLPVAFEAFPN